jgi:hypothetical protein
MNELIPHKNWMKRNQKWFIPLIGFLIIMLIGSINSGLGGKVKDVSKAYTDTTLYENAIKEVENNKQAIHVLGGIQPIDKMAIAEGFVSYSEDNKKVQSTIRIKGTKGQGKLDILAERNKNSWDYKALKIRVKGVEEPIVIIKK